jgi:Mor family transcriptional regulator
MTDTDKYENMRQLFLDFIDTASDEADEEAWKNKLTMLDEVLAEVKRLRKQLKEANDVIQYALEMSSDDDSTRVFEDYLEVIE